MSSENSHLRNLKKLRLKKGWSQERLAREAGISYIALVKIERGMVKNPKLETLIKLSQTLGVSIDKLVGPQK
jgi:transcriptional regulator with XRE-family HTH domain